jgi:hypothetical protein
VNPARPWFGLVGGLVAEQAGRIAPFTRTGTADGVDRRLMPFINILNDLHTADQICSAFAAGDLVEILRYYQENAPIVERMKEFI